ncbi:MAG: DEAD/DEAH box helicase [Saprospiraceae bacterium]
METRVLRPYQNQGADFLYEHDRAMILAPVGAGKTALTLTAMAAMLQDGHAAKFLVLAPKRVATSVWRQEALKWAPGLRVEICVGTSKQRRAALNAPADVVVANYDALQWLAAQPLKFDVIVFDELTRLKNPSGARFKALHKIIDQFPIRWGLTGSFTSNGLEDVFGQCKIIDQSLLGRSKGAFLQTYFFLINSDFNDWSPRPGALEQVMAKIRPATFVLEPDVYSDKLPPLHTVEMRCDLPDRAPYEKMKKDLVVQFPTAEITATNAAVVTNKLQQMASGFVYDTLRTPDVNTPGKWQVTQTPVWFSSHKFDLLDDLLQENQHANTLLVYMYQEELEELKRRYPQLQTLDSPNVIDRWNRGEVELLAVHPKSAGHGLNLQFGGNKIVFVSLPWSFELYEQTVGRLHRSGQTREVWCYVLLTNNTVDERIWAALHNKRAISQIALEELK